MRQTGDSVHAIGNTCPTGAYVMAERGPAAFSIGASILSMPAVRIGR
jgi:hypothetical protein